MSPSPHFIRGLQRNLLFLCNFAQDLEPSAIAELDTRHKNIIQAVEMGLTLPQTRLSAKKLIAAVFNHIFNRGYGGQWKPILARAGKHRDDEHTALQITLINQYGQLLCSSRRFDEALSSHTRAAELAQQCKDEYALAESWFRLSVTHRQKNELKRAYSLGLSALEILEGKPDGAQLLASVQHTLGLVVDNMGDTVSAEAFLRQSVTNWEQLNAPTELARAYSSLALLLQKTNHFKKADLYFQQALAQIDKTGSTIDKYRVQNNRGILFYNQDKFGQALLAFKEAKNKLYTIQPWPSLLMGVLEHNIGNTLIAQSFFIDAIPYLQTACHIWQQIDDPLRLGKSLGTLGQAFEGSGLINKALAQYKKALHQLSQFPNNAFAKENALKFKHQHEHLLQGKENMGLASATANPNQY